MRMKKREDEFLREEREIQEEYERKNSGVKPATIVILIVCAIFVGYIVTIFFTKYLPLMQGTNTSITDLFKKNPFGDKEYVRILMLGVDNSAKDGNGLCDTMVLFTINTNTKEVRALTFPRDTYVDMEGSRGHKLNSSHKNGGAENVVKVIEEQFLYPTTIDYYVKTTTKGLRGMVDLLGGVYIVVEKNMNYDDNWGNLHIHLKGSPEKQLLNGVDAEGYVRFRKDRYGDTGYTFKEGEKVNVGRTARQQKFMMALCNRVISLPSKTERAEFLKTCYDKGYIESNLKLTDWNSMADFFVDMKPEQMMMEVLPGEPKMVGGASYWVVNEEEAPGAISRCVLFEGTNPKIPQEIERDKNGDPIVGEPAKSPSETIISIKNGSGIKGLAAKIASKLGENNYTNTTTGNADSFDYAVTEIKCKDQSTGFVLQKILGAGKVSLDKNLSEDVIIIVGKDLEQ